MRRLSSFAIAFLLMISVGLSEIISIMEQTPQPFYAFDPQKSTIPGLWSMSCKDTWSWKKQSEQIGLDDLHLSF